MLVNFANNLIEFHEFLTRKEMNNYLFQCDLGHIILGEEIENSDKYYVALINNQTETNHYFGVGICSESYGLKPHILLLPDQITLLFGFNNQVVGINLNQKNIMFKINLNSLFYYFLPMYEKNIIIIVQELDVMAITQNGQELWHYGKDVITKTSINGENLQINFMDEKPAYVNIYSGQLVKVNV